MVKTCCIKTCKSESYAGCGISFHSFPSKEEFKQEWLDVIPESQTITKNSVVCCLHFKPADFHIAKSRRVLNANAVPSIFPVPKNNQILELSDILLPSKPVLEPTPSTSQAGLSKPMKIHVSTPSHSDQPPAKKVRLSFKDVAIQTEMQRHSSPAEDDLKRKVKILTLRLNRRESKLKNLESILSILNKRKSNYDEVKHMMKNNFVNRYTQSLARTSSHHLAPSSCVEIRNIPQLENETTGKLSNTICNISQLVGAPISQSEIRDVYRQPGNPSQTSRPVVAEFTTVQTKQNLLMAVRSYNKTKTSKEDKLNTELIGVPGKCQAVYVEELLSTSSKKLFYLARQFAKDNQYSFCWTSNGNIFLRKQVGDKQVLINSEKCIQDLNANIPKLNI